MEDSTIVAEGMVTEETTEVVEETTEETSEVVEETTESTEETAEITAEAPKKKPSYQERINELTRIRRQAEREAKAKEEEAEYWKNLALGKAEQQPISDGRPQQESFDTIEAYEDALFDWRDAKRNEKAEKEKAVKAQEEALNTFNKNAKKMREQYEDFDEVMEIPVFSDTMRKALMSIENGPMIAYHIGSNPEVADALLPLSPEKQIYEIAKIERELILAQNTKKKTDAPAPLTPVGGQSAVEKDPSKMTIAEYMEHEKQQKLAKIQKSLGG